ncbi:MAG: SGNH/GDSL hydrolase family protein [Acidobacteria bacterium]|nr:SGNH/GDSL hydrolase family protein [Acidobacteriota bacterium]
MRLFSLRPWTGRFALAAATLVLVSAGCDALTKPTEPGPVVTGVVSYTALGASDAIGYGSSSPCVPFSPCPDGTGYVQIVARRLRAATPNLAFLNLGVPGAVLSREIMTIGNSLGRGIPANMIDGQLPFVAVGSTIVTVFSDANGVNTIGAALKPLASSARPAYAQTQVQNFARDFLSFISGITSRAGGATVVVLNLPNLARLPYAAGYNDDERSFLRQLSAGFTAGMNATRSSKVRIVDLMCHAPVYQAAFYSSDGFHPSDYGYSVMADLVTAAIAAPPAPPATTCSFM